MSTIRLYKIKVSFFTCNAMVVYEKWMLTKFILVSSPIDIFKFNFNLNCSFFFF